MSKPTLSLEMDVIKNGLIKTKLFIKFSSKVLQNKLFKIAVMLAVMLALELRTKICSTI